MHSAYRAQDWNRVEAALPQIDRLFSDLKLGLTHYADLFRERVVALRAEPPPPNWDGVFASTKK
jgi:adenylate cyclase